MSGWLAIVNPAAGRRGEADAALRVLTGHSRLAPAVATTTAAGHATELARGAAGFLGIVYYFIPKRVERPVYSYRLSIVHFWTLIFLYIWAGPHHLHYTALPEWAQTP